MTHEVSDPAARLSNLLEPAPEAREEIALRHADFSRLRRDVEALRADTSTESGEGATWATFAFGIAAAALLAVIAELAQPDSSQVVVAVYVCTIAAGIIVGGVCMHFSKRLGKARVDLVDRLCDDMDTIESYYPSAATAADMEA